MEPTNDFQLTPLIFNSLSSSSNKTSPSAFVAIKASSDVWHQRLGHRLHVRLLQDIIARNKLPCTPKGVQHVCNAYQLGKAKRLHLPLIINIEWSIDQLVS